MAELIKTLNICKLGRKSQRGYYFKESTVSEFIASDAWAKRKAAQTATVLATHYARRKPKDEGDKEAVGAADYQLVDQKIVGVVIDMFIEDGYWRVKVKIFDPDNFKGSEGEKVISYVYGLVNSGMKLTSSAGILAYYNPTTKEGEKIYDFVGVDFTLSPDFAEGGIID